MITSSEPTWPDVATDLVEYLVVLIPDVDALAIVGAELVDVVASSAIRILDLVLVAVDDDGAVEVVDLDAVRGLDAVRRLTAPQGVLLSRHDIELIALAVEPGSHAVVIVAEDRWAERLGAAVRGFGGEVCAGERIARQRVEAALARPDDRREESW